MKKFIPLFLVLLAGFGAILYANLSGPYSRKQETQLLPVYGEKAAYGYDTTYHVIYNFSFINQLGDTITEKNIKNKDFVAEYFFTTCRNICPVMNKNMMKVAKAFEGDTSFKILSHTVKPEEDSVPVLLEYAKLHQADPKNWWFLTGSKQKLYSMARESYLMNNDAGDGGRADFIHTQLFALVDKQKRLRGFYDGTDTTEVNKLISDIYLLKEEEKVNSEKQ